MADYFNITCKKEKHDSKIKNNSEKKLFPHKIKKRVLIHKFLKDIYLILFGFIFLLLPQKISLLYNYIELEVNKKGPNQILSDEYKTPTQIRVYVNDKVKCTNDKSINVSSKGDKIKLELINDTLTDFSYMFSNLTNIVSVNMAVNYGEHIIMTYMFRNCKNLESFNINIANNQLYLINDMKGMFYNCSSLASFSLGIFYSI